MERIAKLLPQCQVVVFEDYDKGAINSSIIESTVLPWRRNTTFRRWSIRREEIFLLTKMSLFFKPNLKELREGLKIEVAAANQQQVEKATALLKDKLQAKGVMVTLPNTACTSDLRIRK